MSVSLYPTFLDIEATGLIIDSYPIEIAWNDAHGKLTSFLIKPDPEWTYWSDEAAKMHRISREELAKKGISIQAACDLLDASLAGGHIHSDAPYYERQWLDRLYDTAGRKRPFTVKKVSDITEIHRALEVREGPSYYRQFHAQAFEELGDRHRAEVDVRAFMRIFELSVEAGL